MLILKIRIKWRDYFFTKPLGQMLFARKTLSKITFIQAAFIENNQNTQQEYHLAEKHSIEWYASKYSRYNAIQYNNTIRCDPKHFIN